MASKRRIRWNECTKKTQNGIVFDDINKAWYAIKRQNRLGYLHPYKCSFCHKFHYGKKSSVGKTTIWNKRDFGNGRRRK